MPTSERRLAQVSIGAKQARYRAWQSLLSLSLPLAGQGWGGGTRKKVRKFRCNRCNLCD